MRPQHITAENFVEKMGIKKDEKGASMRPQHITAENPITGDSTPLRMPELQ